MLSETIHSLVDSGNQALLLIGLRSAENSPDDRHQYGYGKRLTACILVPHSIDLIMLHALLFCFLAFVAYTFGRWCLPWGLFGIYYYFSSIRRVCRATILTSDIVLIIVFMFVVRCGAGVSMWNSVRYMY
jgi:hypothetical protein